MRLYFDLDRGHFVGSPGFTPKLSRVEFKRGDASEILLGFYRASVQETLAAGVQINLMIKEDGKYDADPVVSDSSWTEPVAPNMDYYAQPNFNTTELDALLNSGDGDEDNDLPYVDLMLEITWSEDAGASWRSSDTVQARVWNDVVKGLEGVPTSGVPAYPSAGAITDHIAAEDNPHNVTAAQVGSISESEADLRYLTAADPTFSNLVNLLEMGNSAGFSVMGDSTGNATNEWVGLVTSELASRYPNHGVFFDVINTGTGEYDRNTIQALPNGDQYWRVPTSSNIFPIQMGRDAIKRVNRDLDVAVELQLDDWGATFPNGSTADLLTDYVGGGGNRSFRFTLRQDGRLEFQWTPDGVSFPGALSGIAHTFNGNDRGWLRVSLVGDNGAGSYECKFYQSSDGETWAQIGATRTGVSVGGLFEADSSFSIMQASQQLPPSNVYSVRVLDEVDGNPCNPQAMDAWSNTSTSNDVELIGSPSLVVTNYSFPGYSTEQAVAVDYGAKFNNNMDTNFFVSLSHNDGYAGGYNAWAYWLGGIEQIVGSLQTRLPFAQPTLVSQNPKTDYATDLASRQHSLRCSSLAGWALQRGYGHIDAHGAFFADSRPLTQLNDDPDTTHPSLEGSQLWADVVLRKIDSALPRFF